MVMVLVQSASECMHWQNLKGFSDNDLRFIELHVFAIFGEPARFAAGKSELQTLQEELARRSYPSFPYRCSE